MNKTKTIITALSVALVLSIGGTVFLYSQLQAAQKIVAESTAKLDTQTAEIKTLTELSEKQTAEIKALTELSEKQAAEIKALTELTEKQATEKPPTTEKPATPPEAEKPPVEKPAVEKPVTPSKPAGWDTPVIPEGGGFGEGTDDTTDDGSHVTGELGNPFN